MNIRMIAIDDASAFLELNYKLDAETNFMLFEAGERTTTIEQIESRIKTTLQSTNEMVFVLEVDEQIVGYAMVIGGRLNRNFHKGSLVMGIVQKYTGMGNGSKLFEHLIKWCKASELHRLELTVMTHNERAIALYKKYGFSIEGTIRDSLLVDNVFVDEYMMSLILN